MVFEGRRFMKLKRTLHAVKVTEYNDLAKAVNENQVVIVVTGKLYEEVLEKAKLGNQINTNKLLTKILLVGGILTGGAAAIIIGAIGAVANVAIPNDFKNYDIKINKNKKRIELYLKKGKDKYDPKHDTLFI